MLAFEKGYSAIPGVKAMPINKWGDFLRVLRELKKPEAHEVYETIIVDTADIAYQLCEDYICAQEGVDSVADIPFGKGYGLVANEFDEKLRSITQMDYGLVQISHSVDKVFTDENGREFNQIVPTLPKKAQTIVSRMCDIIGYSRSVEKEDGTFGTRLFMRGTPRYIAGSRFSDVPEIGYKFPQSIDFSFENLTKTIADAVEALEKKYGEDAITSDVGNHNATIDAPELEDSIQKFNEIVSQLMDRNPEYFAPRITKAVETHFGRGKKMTEATLDQADLAALVVQEVGDLLELNV